MTKHIITFLEESKKKPLMYFNSTDSIVDFVYGVEIALNIQPGFHFRHLVNALKSKYDLDQMQLFIDEAISYLKDIKT
jgi:hypothetical protein